MEQHKHKIAVITCTRAEYGYLKRVMRLVEVDADLELQLVAGGAHLRQEQGYTLHMIEEDGFRIDAKLDYLQFDNTEKGIVEAMALCQKQCAEVFSNLMPDAIVVLGDRYELLPICSAALVMRIPIVHISGGDVTEGAIDNEIRNAITMMADLHFPGTEDSAANIRRMRNTSQHIYAVGEPSIENLAKEQLLTKQELSDTFGWDAAKPWYVVTLHPETKLTLQENIAMARTMMQVLAEQQDAQVIVTLANTDCGGEEMNAVYKEYAEQYEHIYVYPSLGQKNFNSAMAQAYCVMGNSSSGIVEAPFLAVPVINIGLRQEGRHRCSNIIDVPECTEASLRAALAQIPTMHPQSDTYWGDGNTSQKIVDTIKDFLGL